jgi:hypothetical protein
MNIRRFIPLVGAVLFAAPISLLALLAVSPAQAQPTAITACKQLSPGNYVLTKNINTNKDMSACLTITTLGGVTIDLGGFTISTLANQTGISASNRGASVIVRNGTIVAGNGISLGSGPRSVVERMQVISILGLPPLSGPVGGTGISATGIVKDNVVLGGFSLGVAAGGTVTGNYIGPNFAINPANPGPLISRSPTNGMSVSSGSTVIGNTIELSASLGSGQVGLEAACPSNVTNNTFTGSAKNIELNGGGCENTYNVAP